MNNHSASIGDILKTKRISLEISIEEVSHKLKVKKQDIINLEENNLDLITRHLYLSGFIKSYGKILKINNDIIDEYISGMARKCNTKNTKHQLVNLDREQNKNPDKDDLVNALLIFTMIYLLLISLSQFKTQNLKITNLIINHLGKIE
ncbi:MAG: Helix-turn-helix domain [Rickettsiaceae bacterium]|jgi:cytoskeleton protein RodZ|nr:Helix-turn-helix domain [Rickettsiaceae bacterium]